MTLVTAYVVAHERARVPFFCAKEGLGDDKQTQERFPALGTDGPDAGAVGAGLAESFLAMLRAKARRRDSSHPPMEVGIRMWRRVPWCFIDDVHGPQLQRFRALGIELGGVDEFLRHILRPWPKMTRRCRSRSAWAWRLMASCRLAGMATSRISNELTVTPIPRLGRRITCFRCVGFLGSERSSDSTEEPIISRKLGLGHTLHRAVVIGDPQPQRARRHAPSRRRWHPHSPARWSLVRACSALTSVVRIRWSITPRFGRPIGTRDEGPGPSPHAACPDAGTTARFPLLGILTE